MRSTRFPSKILHFNNATHRNQMTNITICLCWQLTLDAPIGVVDSRQIIIKMLKYNEGLIISNQLLFEYNYLKVNLSQVLWAAQFKHAWQEGRKWRSHTAFFYGEGDDLRNLSFFFPYNQGLTGEIKLEGNVIYLCSKLNM